MSPETASLAVLADALADPRLSYKAKGLFAALCHRYTADQPTRQADLADAASDGKLAIASGMRELYEHGYVRSETLRKGNGGSITGRRHCLNICPDRPGVWGWRLPYSDDPHPLAALRVIEIHHSDLPALDWTVRAEGELHGALPEKTPVDLKQRHRTFETWARRLDAALLPPRRCKGYLVLRAGTPATPGNDRKVPVWLHAEIDDSLA